MTKKEAVDKLLERCKRLMEALALSERLEKTEIHPSENPLVLHLYANKAELEAEVRKAYKPNYELFPSSMYEIYLENYKKNAIRIVKENIALSFNLNPEEMNNVDESFLAAVFGSGFFEPNKGVLNDQKD